MLPGLVGPFVIFLLLTFLMLIVSDIVVLMIVPIALCIRGFVVTGCMAVIMVIVLIIEVLVVYITLIEMSVSVASSVMQMVMGHRMGVNYWLHFDDKVASFDRYIFRVKNTRVLFKAASCLLPSLSIKCVEIVSPV